MSTLTSWPTAPAMVALLICGALAGCGDDSHHDDSAVDEGASHHGGDSSTDEGSHSATDEGGMPPGATCPSDNTLTYETFGEDFMASYCTRCHSSKLEGAARNGAPLDHDFNSLVGVLSVAEHIDEYAAAGPDAVNEVMPPDGEAPSAEERELLGQWLACELLRLR